jgi:ParB family transcriptional regulator, chromosome partitioning protein
VLQAYRAGKLTLTQVRLLARLKDRDRQAGFAQDALGGYFHEQGLRSLVTSGRITVEDPRFALVSEAAYAEGGGRLSADLFGELPAEVLDGDRLDELWRAAAARTADGLAGAGITVAFSRERGLRAPEGLEHLPFVHWGSLPEDLTAQFDRARDDIEAAMALVTEATDETREAALAQMLLARLVLARLAAGRGEVAAVLLSPARDGLDAVFYQRPAPPLPAAEQPSDEAKDEDEPEDDDDTPVGESRSASGRRRWDPDIPARAVVVETAGVTHIQHAARTAMATRGLIRDLVDHPDVAQIVVTAQLFKHLALNDTITSDASLLRIAAPNGPVPAGEDDLEGEVWRRLAARRDSFLESGLRPIGFVAALAETDRMALLAELVAVTVDLREARTTSIRRETRAEAEEVAALCGADLAQRWTPDDAFLAVHSRTQLLEFMAEMDAEAPRGGGVRKEEVVRATAEAAAERRWLPACLRWGVEDPVAAEAPGPEIEAPAEAEAEAEPEATGEPAAGGPAEPLAA